jgi:hydroxypyruvate isomerase
MPKCAAILTILFNAVDFLNRFSPAAQAGFAGVEYLFPYDYAKEELAERLDAHGLTQMLHSLSHQRLFAAIGSGR